MFKTARPPSYTPIPSSDADPEQYNNEQHPQQDPTELRPWAAHNLSHLDAESDARFAAESDRLQQASVEARSRPVLLNRRPGFYRKALLASVVVNAILVMLVGWLWMRVRMYKAVCKLEAEVVTGVGVEAVNTGMFEGGSPARAVP